MTDEELYALKDRASERFLSLPGVTAVGLGGRLRDGRPTGEVAIKVFVAAKRPASELPAEEVLPTEFAGVRVDVETGGPFRLADAPVPDEPLGSPDVSADKEDGSKQRPLTGGIRIIPKIAGATGGTLGCFVQHATNDSLFYALTAFHVLTAKHHTVLPEAGKTRVGQPDSLDPPAKGASPLFGTFAGGQLTPPADAAVIQLDADLRFLPEVREIGALLDVAAPPTVDQAKARTFLVRKRGQTTRLTGGVVIAVGANAQLPDGTFANTMLVEPRPNPGLPAGTQIFFGTSGDSGSAVIVQTDVTDAGGAVIRREKRLLGLLFAQGPLTDTAGKPVPRVLGLVTPIATVFSTLKDAGVPVKLVTATKEGDVRPVPKPHTAAPVATAAP